MSLAIDVEKVYSVLLADGWHDVLDNSFDIDAYEYMQGESVRFKGGQSPLITSTGFYFKETHGNGGSVLYYGPLTSIIAVKQRGDPGSPNPF